MDSTQLKLTQKAIDTFTGDHADHFASLSEAPTQIFNRISALIILDQDVQQKVKDYGSNDWLNGLDPSFRKWGRERFVNYLLKVFAQKLIELLSNGTVQFVTTPTPEGLAQFEHLQVMAGLKPAPPPPPKQKTAAELLTEEVLVDFNGIYDEKKKLIKPPISMSLMREKCRTRRDYDAEYGRLADTNVLASSITSSYSGSELVIGG